MIGLTPAASAAFTCGVRFASTVASVSCLVVVSELDYEPIAFFASREEMSVQKPKSPDAAPLLA